jgi:hypothetical protein
MSTAPIEITRSTPVLRCTVIVLSAAGEHRCSKLATVLRTTASDRYQPMCSHHARCVMEPEADEVKT